MRVGVIGCRNIDTYDIQEIISYIPKQCSEIVSGGAQGIDQMAREIAKTLSVPITEFLPDYQKYGRAAPVRRNQQIVDYSDLIIAVWDGESKGTRDALLRALKSGKAIKPIIVGGSDFFHADDHEE